MRTLAVIPKFSPGTRSAKTVFLTRTSTLHGQENVLLPLSFRERGIFSMAITGRGDTVHVCWSLSSWGEDHRARFLVLDNRREWRSLAHVCQS